MRDTVELLESIGRDAHLRHASPEELAKALEAAGASAGVIALAANGDGSLLTEELGLVKLHAEHMTQTGGFEGDDEPTEDPGHDDDQDDRDAGDANVGRLA
jgi:hypothetical protein